MSHSSRIFSVSFDRVIILAYVTVLPGPPNFLCQSLREPFVMQNNAVAITNAVENPRHMKSVNRIPFDDSQSSSSFEISEKRLSRNFSGDLHLRTFFFFFCLSIGIIKLFLVQKGE